MWYQCRCWLWQQLTNILRHIYIFVILSCLQLWLWLLAYTFLFPFFPFFFQSFRSFLRSLRPSAFLFVIPYFSLFFGLSPDKTTLFHIIPWPSIASSSSFFHIPNPALMYWKIPNWPLYNHFIYIMYFFTLRIGKYSPSSFVPLNFVLVSDNFDFGLSINQTLL
jgi:hypothetical protein